MNIRNTLIALLSLPTIALGQTSSQMPKYSPPNTDFSAEASDLIQNSSELIDTRQLKSFDSDNQSSLPSKSMNQQSLQSMGGVAGGGGCLVQSQSGDQYTYELLDFTAQGRSTGISEEGDKIKTTSLMNKIGIDVIDQRQLRSYALAQSKVQSWIDAGKSKIIAPMVLQVLNSMSVFVTPYRPLFIANGCVASPYVHGKILTVVDFRPINSLDLNLLVSKPVFEILDLENQAGLLIHEAFRYSQIVMQEKISDTLIQQLTTTIALDNPSDSEDLESRFQVINWDGAVASLAVFIKGANDSIKALCKNTSDFNLLPVESKKALVSVCQDVKSTTMSDHDKENSLIAARSVVHEERIRFAFGSVTATELDHYALLLSATLDSVNEEEVGRGELSISASDSLSKLSNVFIQADLPLALKKMRDGWYPQGVRYMQQTWQANFDSGRYSK